MALSSVALSALLAGACSKNPKEPSGDDLMGTWFCEFYEEEWGGDCVIEYSFQKDGEAALNLIVGGGEEQGSIPMLWRTDDDKLYIIQKENKELYEEVGLEWPCAVYNVSGSNLRFQYEGDVIDFTRKN